MGRWVWFPGTVLGLGFGFPAAIGIGLASAALATAFWLGRKSAQATTPPAQP